MRKLEADVVIVAGGMSGTCAAVAAAEKGASVLVFEKGATLGGAANMGMGFFAAGSHFQKSNMIDFTPEDAFKRLMEYNHWRSDARLVRKLYDQSASTIEWIEDMGVEFLGAYPYFKDSEATWHIVKTPGSSKPAERCASLMVKAIADRARELGVEFHFNTPVREIIREGKRVSGVIAVDSSGEEIHADCDAVIVCTGGFGDNPQMIEEQLGYRHGEDLYSFRIPGVVGEGMKMVWAIGGGRTPCNIEMTYESPGMSGGFKVDAMMRQPNLMVNLDGRRFINEEIMCNTPYTGNAINLQKKRVGFSIISDELIDSYRDGGLDYRTYHKDAVSTVDGLQNALDNYFQGENEEDPQRVMMMQILGVKNPAQRFLFQGNSLEELAEKAGIDPKGLRETVEEYNEMCAVGRDSLFGKNSRYLRPITGSKFYAIAYYPSGYGSLGGIKVDDCLRVVTQDGDPIPGLYSAGTDSCNIFGDSYCFYLPGSTMGYAINSGRMAGYNAVDYLDSDEFVED